MHFTSKDLSFAYFSFLGVGKLILAGLSNRRCRWHRRKIYQRCRWHWWKIFRQCRWHRWSKLIREYLREFSKKFKKAPMEFLGSWGILIHEKKLEVEKISCQTPFKGPRDCVMRMRWSFLTNCTGGWFLILNASRFFIEINIFFPIM